uniref:Uncharacterized protein n=1 Tax=Cryptomonas curvata TaxID=233186 RepID=A0A7S0MB41_9CRYP|mmetsp:Transcript_28923/g.60753  ORF Transcript_28923/g.60753 Transcript_28923/m.60753 type:complete len:1344 (+) Transcript_28923:1960-5991(+)
MFVDRDQGHESAGADCGEFVCTAADEEGLLYRRNLAGGTQYAAPECEASSRAAGGVSSTSKCLHQAGWSACRAGCCSSSIVQTHAECGLGGQSTAGETQPSVMMGGAAAEQQPGGGVSAADPACGGPAGCGSGEQPESTAGESPSKETGGGAAAAVQQSEGEIGAAEPECGGSAQRLPLDDFAYCHNLKLFTALTDFEIELDQRTRAYAEVCQKQASKTGWLNPLDYCFSGKGTQAWKDGRVECGNRAGTNGGGQKENPGDVVPIPLPLAPPRKSYSSNSGKISASAVRYRRLRTAYIGGLYLQLIIRNHCTEGDGNVDAEWNVAGEKRKRDSAEDTEEANAAGSGGSNGSEKENDEQRRMLAAVSAFLSDLPRPLLKVLMHDARVVSTKIKSETKMRKKILLEIKQEAKRTKQDPMHVLETAVKMASTTGTMRQYCVLGALLNRTGTGGNTLPTAARLAEAKRELIELAVQDLKLTSTPDGYRSSLKRVVEMEALRLMQTVFLSKNREARLVNLDPDERLNWQDHFDVKLTFDARRVTKHCAQTEVMIIFLPKGQDGVDRCQKAVHIRTIAMWTGKDSKENVVRNLSEIVKEVAELEVDGIVFSHGADSFLGVAESSYCMAHKEDRHLPFELFKVKKSTNFWKLANDNDTKVETLWAINTGEDRQTNGGKMRKLTDVGLVACTLPCLDKELARLCAQPAAPPVIQPSAPEVGLRAPQRKKKVAAAIPSETPSHTFPTNSDKDVIMRCCGGWKSNHPASCQCLKCLIPAGTIVRRLIQPGFSRESEYLNQYWNGVSRGRFPFCALHCNMRIAEAMFYNICQNALAAGDPAVARLNSAMELIGLKSKKIQKVRMFSCDNYERLSFLGHEALHLLKKDRDSGKRNVQVLLEHLWPSGDASESAEGVDFVNRSVELWECWGEVVELMSERNPENLRKWVDGMHGDGFARFGKVCREFCFRYQSMFHKTHCKSFYLHTLLAHGGDFMRELEKHGMCLGMMSNSGAERRHEYGRRAFRRSLCGGCWAKHDPELANKANMSAFLTLREILIWQYGSDLLNHEKARLAAEPPDGSESGADGLPSRPAPSEQPRPRCLLTEANLEKHCGNSEMAERLNQLLKPLLSPTEEAAESRRVPMEADPTESVLGETAREGWGLVRHDRSLVLNTIPVPQEEAAGLSGNCYSCSAGEKTYDAGRDSRLTNNICDVVSDVDGDGSDDDSSFDGSGSDCSESGSVSSESGSDCASRPDPEFDSKMRYFYQMMRKATQSGRAAQVAFSEGVRAQLLGARPGGTLLGARACSLALILAFGSLIRKKMLWLVLGRRVPTRRPLCNRRQLRHPSWPAQRLRGL